MKIFKNFIRFWFVRNEVRKGRLLVMWKDVDGEVKGWECDGGNETVTLAKISMVISNFKTLKTRRIVGSPLPNSLE